MTIQKLEGRDHFVLPVTMLTQGVHEGSQGPLLYLAADLRQSITAWNGKAVIVYHPALAESAASPEIFSKQRIGTIFNTRFRNNRLIADAWIDVARVRLVNFDVARAIEAGKSVEVSTGLITDADNQRGVFNGKRYNAIARNIYPDHLAVLPNQVGACSIRDGCGLAVA